MKYKVDEQLSWLKPYLRIASKQINLSRLSIVKTTLFDESTVNRQTFAFCTFDGKNYEISIDRFYQTHIHKKGRKCKRILKEHSKLEVLELLAHELAHIGNAKEFELHSPRHKAIECKLMVKFMAQLQSEGYKNEEIELKYYKQEKRQCLAKR